MSAEQMPADEVPATSRMLSAGSLFGFARTLASIFAVSLLLACSVSRKNELRECEANLLATDKRLFRDELVRSCLCKAMQDGVDSQRAIRLCEAECPMALALIADEKNLSVEFTRCICKGIKAGLAEGETYDRCRTLHPPSS